MRSARWPRRSRCRCAARSTSPATGRCRSRGRCDGGKRSLPIAAPLYGATVAALARTGAFPPLNDDVVRYLRHGRGVDTTRMRRDLRFVPTHTTAEAIDAVARSAGPVGAAA